MNERVAIACDHGGYELKEAIKARFKDFDWLDLGTNSADSVDYPDYGQALARKIESGEVSRGILICGSGIGISIAANRFPAVRAALCTSVKMATLAREHNNANVLALGARITDEPLALEMVKTFFSTEFEGGRHQRRVEKLAALP